MNQDEIIKELAKRNKLTYKLNEEIIDDFLSLVTESLTMGVSVKMTGFGTFDVFIGKPRIVVNPQTMEEMEMGFYARPSFRAGRALKHSIKNSAHLNERMAQEAEAAKKIKRTKKISITG